MGGGKELRIGWLLIPRAVIFTIGCLCTFLFSGGLILGYGPLYSTLVAEEEWHELCNNHSDVCPAQASRLQSLFTTGYISLSLSNAFFGICLDTLGPRWTSVFGLALSIVGNLCFAFGNSISRGGIAFFFGFSCIAAGGMGVFLSTFQFANLFQRPALPCSILSAIFNCSGYIYIVLQVGQFTKQDFFSVYACMAAAGLVIVFVFYPIKSNMTQHMTSPASGCTITCKPNLKKSKSLFPQVVQECKKKEMWLFIMVFSWISLVNAYVGGAIPDIFQNYANASQVQLQEDYTNYWFPLVSNATFLISPFVGLLIDRNGFVIAFVLCIFFIQCFLGCLLIPSLSMQLLTLCLFCIAQAILYTLQFSYILLCFPPHLYGSLEAATTLGSAFVGTLSFGLNALTQNTFDGDHTVALMILLFPTLFLYLFPYHLFKLRQYMNYHGEHTPCLV